MIIDLFLNERSDVICLLFNISPIIQHLENVLITLLYNLQNKYFCFISKYICSEIDTLVSWEYSFLVEILCHIFLIMMSCVITFQLSIDISLKTFQDFFFITFNQNPWFALVCHNNINNDHWFTSNNTDSSIDPPLKCS